MTTYSQKLEKQLKESQEKCREITLKCNDLLRQKKGNFEEIDTERFHYRTLTMTGILKQINASNRLDNVDEEYDIEKKLPKITHTLLSEEEFSESDSI